MQKQELTALRRAIARHEKARGRRYDSALKAAATAYARDRRTAGAGYAEVAAELGLSYETVRRWCAASRPSTTKSSSTAIVPVTVVEDASSSIAIVSPSGFRLEGLGIGDAVLALRALG